MKREKCIIKSSNIIGDIISRFFRNIKTWCILFISFGGVNTVYAQENKEGELLLRRHELSLGLGLLSFPHSGDDHADSYFTSHYGVAKSDNDRIFGGLRIASVDFGYFYNMDNDWSLGGYFGSAAHTNNHYTINCKEGYTKGDLSNTTLYILPSIRHYWSEPTKKARLYSGFSLGLLTERVEFKPEESDFNPTAQKKGNSIHKTRSGVTYHATFVGVTSTHRRWSGFFELGFGCRGMLLGGIKYAW